MASTIPPSLRSTVIDNFSQVAWSGSGCGSTSKRLGFSVGTRAPIGTDSMGTCICVPVANYVLVTERGLSAERSRQAGGDLSGSLAISGLRIATRDLIRTMPAAGIPAISDRRAGADKEDRGTVESYSHLHAKSRYNLRFEDRHSQPHQPRLSVGIPGASSK